MKHPFTLCTAFSIGTCITVCACGGGAQTPPPKHGITADDPTPSLPTFTPRPTQPDTREEATSAPQPLAAESVATTPRAGEPAELPSPPSAPPENEFGYDTPVAGCFEGKVYALAENTRKLPEEYNTLTQLSVVYACEWNIPQHDWHQGFPNLADRSEWFAIHYSGPFTVKVPGTYRFRTSSDDGTRLFIDGKVVVDNDGVRPMRSVAGTVELSASRHDLTLDYFQGPRYSIALQVYVTAPGASEHLFTARAERSQ